MYDVSAETPDAHIYHVFKHAFCTRNSHCLNTLRWDGNNAIKKATHDEKQTLY